MSRVRKVHVTEASTHIQFMFFLPRPCLGNMPPHRHIGGVLQAISMARPQGKFGATIYYSVSTMSTILKQSDQLLMRSDPCAGANIYVEADKKQNTLDGWLQSS